MPGGWVCDAWTVSSELAATPGLFFRRDTEVWHGWFDGLGAVRVSPDGGFDIDVDLADGPDDDEQTQRAAALRWGWAEPLSWARRGFEVSLGTALRPATADVAVLVRGHTHEVALIVGGLCQRGWAVVAERVVPLRWQDHTVEVVPTGAPVLMARRQATRLGLESHAVRGDTDSVTVDLPRCTEPVDLAAVCHVEMRKTGDAMLDVVAGHERFEVVSGLVAGGVLAAQGTEVAPRDRMARDLRLAALPVARVHLAADELTDTLDAVEAWWTTTGHGEAP